MPASQRILSLLSLENKLVQMTTLSRACTRPYRQTCPKLPYPNDYEAENASPLSTLARWLVARANTVLP